MNQRQTMIDLFQVASELLTAYESDRAALYAASTVGGDSATLNADDRSYIEVMDELIYRARRAIEDAREVLSNVA